MTSSPRSSVSARCRTALGAARRLALTVAAVLALAGCAPGGALSGPPSGAAGAPTPPVVASSAPSTPAAATPSSPSTATTPRAAPTGTPVAPAVHGWVAFAARPSQGGTDIYLSQEGRRAYRLLGSGNGRADLACPAFSPDGRRLVAGRATGSDDAGWHDAALVFTDLTSAGAPSRTTTLTLEGVTEKPCASWSADGRWLALIAGTRDPTGGYLARHGQVWVVDTRTHDIRRLAGLGATDVEWAPRGPELFIASQGLRVHSPGTGRTRSLTGTEGVVALALSPDGGSLAAEHDANGDADGPSALLTMRADGSDQRTLLPGYSASHGIGPVWSPDGEQVAIQRLCDRWVDASGRERICREEHEVVVLTVSERRPGPSAGTTVIDLPRTSRAGVETVWAPFCVSWSPDSTMLLYVAWTTDRQGVLAVPVDTARPAVVLEDALDVDSLGSAHSWAERRG